AYRRDAGRLFHDDDVLVDVADGDVVNKLRQALGPGEQLDLVVLFQAAGRIEPQLAVDLDAAAGDELADLRPRLARQAATENGGDGLIRLKRHHGERLAAHLTH